MCNSHTTSHKLLIPFGSELKNPPKLLDLNYVFVRCQYHLELELKQLADLCEPFYFKVCLTDLNLLPIAFASYLAILLNPFCNWLQTHKFQRVLAISTGLLLIAVVVAGLIYFLSTQIMQFGDTLPVMKQKLLEIIEHIKERATIKFGITESKKTR